MAGNHTSQSGDYPGKWELKKAEVVRGADSLEITNLISEFNVYASIIDPTIVGELLVIDGKFWEFLGWNNQLDGFFI